MLHGRLVGKTLTDLQILSCELHQNAFGGWAPPGAARRSPAFLAVIRGGEGGEGEGKGLK